MALTRSFPTQAPTGLPITDTRRVTAGLVVRNADGTPRAGVFPAHANPVVTGRASMAYDVAPFLAATSRINTGVELVANDAVTIVPTTAAPASNSRLDVIWVRAQFQQHADANNDVVFGVTQGTPAAVPSKPTIPAGALELATAEILATTTTTATAVITQTHAYTAAAGGVVWVRNNADMSAFAPADGAHVFNLADSGVYVRSGGTWKPLAVSQQYTPTITGLNAAQVSVDAWSTRSGDHITGEVIITRTVTGSPTGTVSVTLPSLPASTSQPRHLGMGEIYLANNSTSYFTATRFTGSQAVTMVTLGMSGSALAQGANVTASHPTSAAHNAGTIYRFPFSYRA